MTIQCLMNAKRFTGYGEKNGKGIYFRLMFFFSMMIFPGNDNDDDRLHKLFELLAQLR